MSLDPVAFVARALKHEGALVEPGLAGMDAILPIELARTLELDECIVLADCVQTADPAVVPCGFGTALLERQVAQARATHARADVRLRGAVRRSAARSSWERTVIRNGKSEILDISVGTGVYLRADFWWWAEADDRFEGVVSLAVEPQTGAVPDAGFVRAIDDIGEPSEGVCADGVSACKWLARRLDSALRDAVAPMRAAAERRHARDHQRIARYFASLAAEAGTARRKLDSASLQVRLAQFASERDSKLAELRTRFAVRTGVRLAATRWVEADRASVRVRLHRRKGQRELLAHLPVGASSLDAIACEGCGGSTHSPALCDDELHVLCEGCIPRPQGRFACPACGR